jgi:amino acid transporter
MHERRLTLLQAVSVNMGMMVGVGPFITIPMFVGALGGPQAIVGWIVGAVVASADGLVWSELAAAFPGSGGTFHFYDAIYGSSHPGRLLKFLFVWQFLFSGPLELGSGAVGLGQYAGYVWSPFKRIAWRMTVPSSSSAPWTWEVSWGQILAMALIAMIVALAYRRIEVAGRLMVVLWAGMLLTVCWMIVAGLSAFDARLAFDLPPDAWAVDRRHAFGLGAALGIAMYDFFGYYQVCYLGDEVAEPARIIPRSILISVPLVALAYMLMTLGILGVVPWRDTVRSAHIASDLMLVRYGPWAAYVVTGLILWSGVTGTFSGVLGYSRIPYAAAKSGHFFRALAKTHPTGDFPHRSLLLIGLISAAACLVDLPTVIGALIASRIVIQFIAQIITVFYIRRRPDLAAKLRFRMPLFPLPAVIALSGWIYVFATLEPKVILYGLVSLLLGGAAFVWWSSVSSRAGTADERV